MSSTRPESQSPWGSFEPELPEGVHTNNINLGSESAVYDRHVDFACQAIIDAATQAGTPLADIVGDELWIEGVVSTYAAQSGATSLRTQDVVNKLGRYFTP